MLILLLFFNFMGACNSTENKKKPNKVIAEQINKVQAAPKSVEERKPEIQTPIKKKIKILMKLPDNTETNNEYQEDTLLKDLFSGIAYDKRKDYELVTPEGRKLNDSFNEKISTIFSSDNGEIIVKYVGLDLPDDVYLDYMNTTKIIASLVLEKENFQFVVYNTENKEINSFFFRPNIDHLLYPFNSFSAYCNYGNKLYISGGEEQKDMNQPPQYLNNFISIDLNNISESNVNCEKLVGLKEARTWHSMIFVPKKYIVIVGGIGTKTVEIFDVEKNQISFDSELNEFRSECTLCLIDNCYLYAFCGFLLHHSFVNSIERCNMMQGKRKWDIVEVDFKDNLTFSPSFFSVAYIQQNKLILLGANESRDQNSKSYIYTHKEEGHDAIEEFIPKTSFFNIYKEKLFFPVKEHLSVNIPLVTTSIKTILFNSETLELSETEAAFNNQIC